MGYPIGNQFDFPNCQIGAEWLSYLLPHFWKNKDFRSIYFSENYAFDTFGAACYTSLRMLSTSKRCMAQASAACVVATGEAESTYQQTIVKH